MDTAINRGAVSNVSQRRTQEEPGHVSTNYPPKTCAREGCDQPLIRHHASIADWEKRKYCSLRCNSMTQRTPIEHGSPKGAQKHRRHGTPICEACRTAERAYNAELRRAVRAIQLRALSRVTPSQRSKDGSNRRSA